MSKSLVTLFTDLQTLPWRTAGNDVNYQFVQEGSTLYIYFQGSSSTMDWIRNFFFFKRPYKDMSIPYYVHGGFLAAWKEVEDIIIERIADSSLTSIVTVGYSHGGALAMLCHECVWFNRPDIRDQVIGIGFEAPRVYHGWWVKKALRERWANFTVIRNHTDLVTHMPPILFCFRHVGTLRKIGRHAKYGPIRAHYPDKVLESLKAEPDGDDPIQ